MIEDPYKANLFKGALPHKFEFAREMRHASTEAETKLWQRLRNGKLKGAKFRRQHAMEHFVLDFYCHEVKLCVELDGGIHKTRDNREHDERRTIVLNELGVTVIRISNELVDTDMAAALETISSHLIRLRHLLL